MNLEHPRHRASQAYVDLNLLLIAESITSSSTSPCIDIGINGSGSGCSPSAMSSGHDETTLFIPRI